MVLFVSFCFLLLFSSILMGRRSIIILSISNILSASLLFWLEARDVLKDVKNLWIGQLGWEMMILSLSYLADAVGAIVFDIFGQHWSFRNNGVVYNSFMILSNLLYYISSILKTSLTPLLSPLELCYSIYQYLIVRRQRTKQEQFFLSIHLFRSLLSLFFYLKTFIPTELLDRVDVERTASYIILVITGSVIFISLLYKQPFLLLGCIFVIVVFVAETMEYLMNTSTLYSILSLLSIFTGMLIRK